MDNAILCLLIDDDLDDQEIFLMALEEIDKSIKCIMYNNGIDALEALKLNGLQTPDYIFIDVNMPKMNGFDCLKEIKKLAHINTAKLIMYSTTLEKEMVAKSKELGVMDFVVKPPGLALLRERLSDVFQKKN